MVHVRLTVAMKHRIFADYPQVHKLFLEMVPHEIPEMNFWKRYFRSKTKHQNVAQGGGGAEDDKQFLEASRSKPAAAAVLASRAYPDTNLASEEISSSFHSGSCSLASRLRRSWAPQRVT